MAKAQNKITKTLKNNMKMLIQKQYIKIILK